MDLSQYNAGVVDALEEIKGTTVATPVQEEIGTDTLLNDLRSIIVDEIGDKLANLIVREYSGKVFTEENVLDLLRSTIVESDTTPMPPEQKSTTPTPVESPEHTKKIKQSDKPKRKNKVSGYNIFKKDPDIKKKINVEYLPRKELDKSLKFSTVAGEMWKKVDQTPYINQADEINKANEMSSMTTVNDPIVAAVSTDTPVNTTTTVSS